MTHSEFNLELSILINKFESIKLNHERALKRDAPIAFYFSIVYEFKRYELAIKELTRTLEKLESNNFFEYVEGLDTNIIKYVAQRYNQSSNMFSLTEYLLDQDVNILVYKNLCIILGKKNVIA